MICKRGSLSQFSAEPMLVEFPSALMWPCMIEWELELASVCYYQISMCHETWQLGMFGK